MTYMIFEELEADFAAKSVADQRQLCAQASAWGLQVIDL
jgi:hypothetical protein